MGSDFDDGKEDKDHTEENIYLVDIFDKDGVRISRKVRVPASRVRFPKVRRENGDPTNEIDELDETIEGTFVAPKVMNNYLSFGFDAEIVTRFHHIRNEQPDTFKRCCNFDAHFIFSPHVFTLYLCTFVSYVCSQIGNKTLYGRLGKRR